MTVRVGCVPDVACVHITVSGELNEDVVHGFLHDCDEARRWVPEA